MKHAHPQHLIITQGKPCLLAVFALTIPMWRPIVAVVLSAPAAEGFNTPFVPSTSLQAQCSSHKTRTHDCYVRCTRRRPRTPCMMAGPNKGQKPAFFTDWPMLETELKAYLAEREAGEPDGSSDAQPAKRNPMLAFLSVDPAQMALENSPEVDEWDGEVDALAYSELTRFGYAYLVEPMMKAGGYAVVSERMGIDLNVRTLKDREYYERINPPVGLKKKETDGFLTLGRAREERLDAVTEITSKDRRKALFEKQAMMDKTKKAAAQAAKPSTLFNSKKVAAVGGRKADADEDVFRPPGLSPELEGPTEWKPPDKTDEPPLQPLLLSLPQRANAVVVFACCALAFGRGTADALKMGILTQDVAEVAVPASLFLLGLNIASATVGASIAKGKGRSVPLWVFKGAFAGLTSVLELKSLPDIGPASGLPSGAEDSKV